MRGLCVTLSHLISLIYTGICCGKIFDTGIYRMRFVIDAILNLAVKNVALLPERLYIHILVDVRVVQYAVAPDMFVILAFVVYRFAILALLKRDLLLMRS